MAGMAAGCPCAACAFAQTWPGKPIVSSAASPPGGGVDIMARPLTPKLVEAYRTSTCK
jgi:tripartite-type tricarboxylate transporter receptor subunit TctC